MYVIRQTAQASIHQYFDFHLHLFFHPEDVGSTLLPNIINMALIFSEHSCKSKNARQLWNVMKSWDLMFSECSVAAIF
jgi:hypothetical protein